MPTYIYETIPSDPNQEPRRFEVTQRMSDDALECDPSSGEKVKKIITGGFGVVGNVLRRSTVVNKASAAATACGCATGRPHKHHHHHHGGGHRHTSACRH